MYLADDLYYEYYYFECGNVLYDIAIIQDKESYELYREEEQKFISTAEFTFKEENGHVSQTEQNDKSSNSWGFTIDDIYNANKNDSFFEHYNSVQTSITIGEVSALLYADKKFKYISAEDMCEGTIDNRTCSYEVGKYLTEFSLDKEKVNMYEKIYFMNDLFTNYVISDVKEDGNDLVITAQLNEYDTAYLMYSMDMEPSDGDTAVSEIRVHADDFIIEKNTVEIINGNDSKTFITLSNEFNCELPDKAKQIYEHMNLPDKRTITLIVNPGSESEYTLSTFGIKGDKIQFFSVDDSDIAQYEDKECTKQYTTETDADTNSDLLIYGKEY